MNTRNASSLFRAVLLAALASTSLFAAYQPAKALCQSKPAYAFELRKEGVEGAVLVSYQITAEGKLADATILGSSDQAFERPTLRAMRGWKFTPAMQDGHAVESEALQLITFTVEEQNPPTSTQSLISKLRLKDSPVLASNKMLRNAVRTLVGEKLLACCQ